MSVKAAATSNVDVTVIIVSWNTKDILYSCLKSVYEHADGITLEVIVIDNASNDGSASMVKKEFPQATLIENSENRGFAAARALFSRKSKSNNILIARTYFTGACKALLGAESLS